MELLLPLDALVAVPEAPVGRREVRIMRMSYSEAGFLYRILTFCISVLIWREVRRILRTLINRSSILPISLHTWKGLHTLHVSA